jgi:nucleotide-binding universal stress UspA family protein
MSYATVMVYLDRDLQANGKRLEVAGALAEKFGAGIMGVGACELGQSAYFAEGPLAARLIEEGRAALKERMAELERQFLASAKPRAKKVEWRSSVEFPTRYAIKQSRSADIIVIGSHRGGVPDPLTQLDPGDLLLQAGRPVLVVPADAGSLDLRKIMIAWKDTREARRAISDALPLLHRADEIKVVEVVEGDDDRVAAVERVRDVATWLSRHSIQASHTVPNARGHAAEQIERAAADMGAGLIVAGAYGHTRLREWILGGVTRSLLTHARRCSLLSY